MLQERALARRTIYFAERQTYWECGGGVRSEALTKTDNLDASILADPRFPKKLVYTSRDESIRACQDLYRRYSRMAVSYLPDRPIAIAVLERRLIRSLRIKGGYGVLNDGRGLFRRTLLWRGGAEVRALRRIAFPADLEMTIPSWSWMAYDGGIDGMDMSFGETEWQPDEISISPTAGDQAAEISISLTAGDQADQGAAATISPPWREVFIPNAYRPRGTTLFTATQRYRPARSSSVS